MPSKKKKYNARFPAGRIKKIMQSDEEIGKVAQAVPVIISHFLHIPRTLELFVDSLLTKTLKITNSRNAKTLSTSHMKQCIMSEQRFDFLRELVKNIPDISVAEEAANYNEDEAQSSPEEQYPDSDTPYDLSMPSTSTQATRSASSAAARTNGGNYNYRATRANGAGSGQSMPNQRAYLIANAQLDDERRAHVQRETEILLRLEQPIGGVSARAAPVAVAASGGSGSLLSSVIKHTTSLNAEGTLPKLARSDSTPANMAAAVQHWPTQTQTQSHRQQRLKHQSQSVPHSNSHSARTISHQPQTHPCSAPKQQKLENARPAQAAIPAPIVSFDFCNKPVVKIEYSNLNMPLPANNTATAPAAPLSAPANITATHHHPTSSQFNFNTEPVINIDLSNINVTTSATTPAVATISIGTIPAALAPIPAPLTNPKATSMAIASFVNPNNNNNNNTTNSSVAVPTAAAAACKNSFFELDEDYDNI